MIVASHFSFNSGVNARLVSHGRVPLSSFCCNLVRETRQMVKHFFFSKKEKKEGIYIYVHRHKKEQSPTE